jgi:hypothetical protein
MFAQSSRSRLTPRDLPRFPDSTLLHRVARAVCRADCLPRKELFESWEVARRARRRFRGGRVVDLACGHALLAHLMLLLDDSSPTAVGADTRLPASAPVLAAAMQAEWPRLAGRVSLVTRAARLRSHGYTVHTQHIPEAITPKNRLLLGEPPPAHGDPQNTKPRLP